MIVGVGPAGGASGGELIGRWWGARTNRRDANGLAAQLSARLCVCRRLMCAQEGSLRTPGGLLPVDFGGRRRLDRQTRLKVMGFSDRLG